jgi:hypothetical protein
LMYFYCWFVVLVKPECSPGLNKLLGTEAKAPSGLAHLTRKRDDLIFSLPSGANWPTLARTFVIERTRRKERFI